MSAVPSSAPIAAKGGIHALTPNLAVELAKHNIRVNAVGPGIIKTPIHGLKEEEFENLNGMQPLGRVGEVKDIVDAVLYLADGQPYIRHRGGPRLAPTSAHGQDVSHG